MPAGTPRRPTSIEGVRECLSRFRTDEAAARGDAIAVRPDDVFIATYPKCGTTLMQAIVHGLRSGGSMDFDEIGDVVPWLEMAHDLGQAPDAEQPFAPRAFKTHLHWGGVPRGGRYLFVAREPAAAAVSMYHFFEGWLFEPGSIDVDSFTHAFLLGGSRSGRYFDHVCAWWPQRHRADVALLAYEDIVAEPRQAIARVATFIGVKADDALIDLVATRTSRAFMLAHGRQFDDHVVRARRDKVMGLPPDAATTKVQHAGPRAALAPDTVAAISACWRSEVAPHTGHDDYAAFRTALGSLA